MICPDRLGRDGTRRRRIAACAILSLIAVAWPASARDVYPRDVYRVAETMAEELALLHREDLTSFIPPEVRRPQKRQPRHVLQEARQVHQSVQTLRALNGLSADSIGALPVRRIEPRDVRARMEAALADLRDLREIYGVSSTVHQVSTREGIGPTDVFVMLQKLRASLRALGLPAVVPNDVYREALTVARETREIADRLRVGIIRTPSRPVSNDKTPGDVYALTREVLIQLAQVVPLMPDVAIAGSVIDPPPRPEAIAPGDVLFLMRTVRADLNAVKASLGLSRPVPLPPAQVGRTPADVFALMRDVQAQWERIGRRVSRASGGEARP